MVLHHRIDRLSQKLYSIERKNNTRERKRGQTRRAASVLDTDLRDIHAG